MPSTTSAVRVTEVDALAGAIRLEFNRRTATMLSSTFSLLRGDGQALTEKQEAALIEGACYFADGVEEYMRDLLEDYDDAS